MMYRLILHGNWVHMKTFESTDLLIFKQVVFADAPQLIAQSLNQFRNNAGATANLSGWS